MLKYTWYRQRPFWFHLHAQSTNKEIVADRHYKVHVRPKRNDILSRYLRHFEIYTVILTSGPTVLLYNWGNNKIKNFKSPVMKVLYTF